VAPPNAIEIQNLSYNFPDGTPALKNVSLAVAEGDRMCIMGPNGAGKTTLLLHLNGVLSPTEGQVRVFGRKVCRKNLREVRRFVGLVFQNPDDQLFCATVFEDVAFGPRNFNVPEAQVQERVRNSLRQVGMEQAAERSAFHLSLGEKKRVALATVLAMESRILVLDEPTSNLDPRGRSHICRILRSMNHTQVIVTHHPHVARALCNRVALIDQGRIVASGPVDEILSDSRLLSKHSLLEEPV